MIGLSQKRKLQKRGRLWFDQFDTCVKLRLPEASCLRNLDHDRINAGLERRRSMRNFGGSWAGFPDLFTADDKKNLHEMCDWLLQHPDHKLMIYTNYLYIYCNGNTLVDSLGKLSFIKSTQVSVTGCELNGHPNCVVLKKSQYTHRSYFKSCHLESTTAHSFKQFLLNQSEIRLSPSLQDWCSKNDWHYLYEGLFLDHNDQSTIVMMSLFVPDCIRKTMCIVVDK